MKRPWPQRRHQPWITCRLWRVFVVLGVICGRVSTAPLRLWHTIYSWSEGDINSWVDPKYQKQATLAVGQQDFPVVQWLRICLPGQETWVSSLVWEDPTCRGATKSMCHNYWTHMQQQRSKAAKNQYIKLKEKSWGGHGNSCTPSDEKQPLPFHIWN